MTKPRRLAIIATGLVLFILGAWFASREEDQIKRRTPTTGVPELTLVTKSTITSPQIPLWGSEAVWSKTFGVTVREWNSPSHLQAMVMAGEGDVWVGHIEGFARAARQGAPVRVLAVTGWRKFYLLSRNPAITTLDSVRDGALAFTPPGSPGVATMKHLLGAHAASTQFLAHEPKQLAMAMLAGRIDTALVPEPLATTLLTKVPDLRVVCGLEEQFPGRRLPLAGIAINTETFAACPAWPGILLEAMQTTTNLGPEVLPFDIDRQMIEQSLARDLIHIEAAVDVVEEINAYLAIIDPSLTITDYVVERQP